MKKRTCSILPSRQEVKPSCAQALSNTPNKHEQADFIPLPPPPPPGKPVPRPGQSVLSEARPVEETMARSPWVKLDHVGFTTPLTASSQDSFHNREDSSSQMLGQNHQQYRSHLEDPAAPSAYAIEERGSTIDRHRRALVLQELVSEDAKKKAFDRRLQGQGDNSAFFQHELASLSRLEGYEGQSYLINPNCVALFPKEVRVGFLRKVGV